MQYQSQIILRYSRCSVVKEWIQAYDYVYKCRGYLNDGTGILLAMLIKYRVYVKNKHMQKLVRKCTHNETILACSP
jgi:hypothetical protein